MTQQSFADDFGTEIRTVSRWINEGKLNNVDTIQELADYFNVDFFDFFSE